jgi:hypothetical protein
MKRRGLMALGIGGIALLAIGGGAAALARPVWEKGRFLNDGRTVIAAVGKAVLEGHLPSESAAQNAAISKLVEAVEALLANFPARTRGEFVELIAILAHPWGRSVMGQTSDWASVSTADTAAWLNKLRFAKLGLQQQGYHALHDVMLAAHFADKSIWKSIGYELPIQI